MSIASNVVALNNTTLASGVPLVREVPFMDGKLISRVLLVEGFSHVDDNNVPVYNCIDIYNGYQGTVTLDNLNNRGLMNRYKRQHTEFQEYTKFRDNESKLSGINIADEPLYRTWSNMIERCHGSSSVAIENRKRGIGVCHEWLCNYFSFESYIGAAPTSKHVLARYDQSKGYAYGNVFWATQEEALRLTGIPTLTEHEVIRIRNLADNGVDTDAIIDQLKLSVNRQSVHNVVIGKSFKDVK